MGATPQQGVPTPSSQLNREAYLMGRHRLGSALLLASLSVTLLGGCNYLRQRGDDFRDIWVLSVGGTHAVDQSAWIAPSLGVFAEALWFGVGAITHNGGSAELLDGRGTFIGLESRTRIGLLIYQWWRIQQVYRNSDTDLPGPAYANGFKDPNPADPALAEWHERMANHGYTRWLLPSGAYDPRKIMIHEDGEFHGGWFPLLRGWQHLWSVQVSAAAGFPLTHISFYVRVGFDVSEIMDFIVSALGYDMWDDDVHYGQM
jgi:hypothetical protein